MALKAGSSNEAQEEQVIAEVSNENSDAITTWIIDFQPGIDILRCGNDPSLMFNELRQLGELSVTLVDSTLPELTDEVA